MSFESGSISMRVFYVPRALPKDAIERFASHAAPPIDTLGDAAIHGWVTGRHLLDRNITEATARFGGYLRLTLMQAERKIPESLLRAECRMEELARIQAGEENLSPSVRREIKRAIQDRLLPQMPPTLKGIHFIHDEAAEVIYCSALSDKQVDAFQIHFAQTLGFSLIPATPDLAAMKKTGTNVRDWAPVSFSPEKDSGEVSQDPGLDFLTWLLFVAEARGGMLKLGDIGDVAVMVEGPLMFVSEGAGAQEAVLRRGEPLLSAEAKTALVGGKKLRRAKVTLARGEEAWTFTLDAVPFTFRNLKMPENKEKVDFISKFQDRMRQLDLFTNMFYGLYARFTGERSKASAWKAAEKEIHAWVSGRRTRG